MEYSVEKTDTGSIQILKRPTGKFAVEIPSLHSPDAVGGVSSSTEKNKGFFQKKILLRADMAEDSAGQLYSYVYRILFGCRAKEKMRALCNSGPGKQQLIKDTLHSFGVRPN
mmetsp:Transcript_9750/g.21719  ORF Transcript_9750/g.21719 Transcript_9750/m.21719 type:complete len:112 (-) Transcript_9750:960-1295(-)